MAKKGLLARKLGMTQLFNADGTLSAVTVLEAGPCRVLGLRTKEKDGYTAVRLGFRRELDAIEDPGEREAEFERMVARAYAHGKALNVATVFEIDDVIDPADSRRRIVEALRAAPPPPPRAGKKRPFVDTW